MTHFNITASDDLCGSHRVSSLWVSDHSSKHATREPTAHPYSISSMKKAEAPGGVMTYLRLLTAWPGEPGPAPEPIMLRARSFPYSVVARLEGVQDKRLQGGQREEARASLAQEAKDCTECGLSEEKIRILSRSSEDMGGGGGLWVLPSTQEEASDALLQKVTIQLSLMQNRVQKRRRPVVLAVSFRDSLWSERSTG